MLLPEAEEQNSSSKEVICARLTSDPTDPEEEKVHSGKMKKCDFSSSSVPHGCDRRRFSPSFFALTTAAMCSLLLTFQLVESFNVDVNSRVVHSGPRGSCDDECMFGFSVAQHRERGTPW